MCGINGFTFPDEILINEMNKKLNHRGPDDSGVFIDGDISLGSTRLAIIDLSKNGHMPMKDMTGRYEIVFNGEIYNFKQLRQRLQKKGYKFRSNSDTEVVVNLFADEGVASFKKLNGMFACGIWDKLTKSLVLARDRIGIKPLYYALPNNQLIFSSEVRALSICKMISRQIRPESLEQYLRLLYVPAPHTIYKDIEKLEPGQYLVWNLGTIKKQYYWNPLSIPQTNASIDEIKQQLVPTIMAAVNDQLILSDRPVGVFLSGGIDSNIVLSCTTQSTNKPINTFTIRFSGVAEENKFNADAELAKHSAAFYHTNHHEINLTPETAVSDFETIINSMDVPIGNATHIPTYELAKASSQTITVALGGDGGDELFGGYDRYFNAFIFDLYQKIPSPLRRIVFDKLIYTFKHNPNESFRTNLLASLTTSKYLAFMGQDEGELQKIHRSDSERVKYDLSTLRGFEDKQAFHTLLPVLDLMHWLPEESLARTDKMTMLSSLEQRVPLLDNRVVDLGLSIPFPMKVGMQIRKKILRDAFTNELPNFISTAPKRGFFSPAAKWVRHTAWKSVINDLLGEDITKACGVYDSKQLHTMVALHLSGEKYNMQHIWTALTLHGWMKSTGAYL